MPHRSRRFRISLAFLTGMRLVVNTGHRLVYPFLPAIARGLGISLEQASLMVSARWLAGLATPAVVRGVGRGERHRRLIAAGLATFALGAAITAASNVYVGALAGFMLMGLAKPAYDVASQAYVAERVPYERRARCLGIFELTWAGGLLVGAPAAGWLIDRGGWNTPFWVISILAVVAVLALGAVLDATPQRLDERAGAFHWDRSAVAFLVAAAAFSGAAEIVFVVLGAWLEDGFGLSLLTLGGVATLIGVAELVGEGGTVAFTDRLGKRAAVILGMMVAAAGFALLAVAHGSLRAGMAAVMLAYLGFEFTIVSAIPFASEARPLTRARFLAWMVVAMSIGRGAGAAAGAVVFDAFGLGGNALAACLINVAAAAVFVAWVREASDQASPHRSVADSGRTGRRS